MPATGIVDYPAMCDALATDIREAGREIRTGTAVLAIEGGDGVTVSTSGVGVRACWLVACAGLQSDRLAAMAGLDPDFRIVPFRGEYYRLASRWNGRLRHLIYPIPDPNLPFLGIHLTRMIDGGVSAGPNAVLGLSREGYPRLSASARDVASYAAFPGFWRMLGGHLGPALSELRNAMSKRAYLDACRKYCPDLSMEDLEPMEAGIRAQALMRDGARACSHCVLIELP